MSAKEFIEEMAAANAWLTEQVFIHQSRVEYSKRMFAAKLHIRSGDKVLVTLTSFEQFEAKVLTVTPMIRPSAPGDVYFSYDLLREVSGETIVVFNLDAEIQSIALIP